MLDGVCYYERFGYLLFHYEVQFYSLDPNQTYNAAYNAHL